MILGVVAASYAVSCATVDPDVGIAWTPLNMAASIKDISVDVSQIAKVKVNNTAVMENPTVVWRL